MTLCTSSVSISASRVRNEGQNALFPISAVCQCAQIIQAVFSFLEKTMIYLNIYISLIIMTTIRHSIPFMFFLYSIFVLSPHTQIYFIQQEHITLLRHGLIQLESYDCNGVILRCVISSQNLRLPRGKHLPILLMTR